MSPLSLRTLPLPTPPARTLRLVALLLLVLSGSIAYGQASPAADLAPAPSRLDITGQYGFFSPLHSDINNYKYEKIDYGAVGSIAGYFNKYVGVQLEGSAFPQGPTDNNCVYTAHIGPILRYPKGRFMPFFHALGGASEIGGPRAQPCNSWGWGVTGGFGLDYVLPAFHNRLAIRPIQGDFQYAQIDNGPLVLPVGTTGGFGEVWNFRLAAGLTVRFGTLGGPAGDTTLTCSADPSSPFPGDPVTLSSMVVNLRPYKHMHYVWTASGGKVTGEEATASLDTAGLAPGTYQVSGRIVEGSREREVAVCSTSFTVRDYDPPTLTCSADKSAINSGDPVTITSVGSSPQNRPLTYTYTTTAGQVAGNGPTAALTTSGVNPGTITVTCNVTDDKNHSATATASVVIATPPAPAALPVTQSLCSISFERDHKRPDRVDNEAKGCLDDIALTLGRDTTAKLLLIGNHAAGENNRDAASRAMNASDYLTKEKGIDPARIDLRIAADPTRTVNTMLVPTGATEDAAPGSAFDTGSVVRKGQAYGIPGQHTAPVRRKKTHKHAAAAPPPAQ